MRKPRPKPTADPLADARLAAVLESISDAYYAVDRDWKIVMFNGSAELFFGMPRSEILGRNLWEIYPLGEGTEFGQLLQWVMRERKPGRLTAPSAMRAGRTVEVRISPLGEEGIGVALDDVSERHNAERALRRSQQRLDLAVGAHAIAIMDWHFPSGKVVWNPEAVALFGLPEGVLEGDVSTWREGMLEEDREQVRAVLVEAMSARRDQATFTFRFRRPDGVVRWVEGAARLLYSANGTPYRFVGTSVDVTERKMAEQHQRLLINELNHRVKNTLAIVQAIAWQSLRTGATKAVREAFEGRLTALAAAHDVVTQQNWEAASIGRIIAQATAPHHAGDGRLTLDGPALDLEPKTAVALGLAMHELATNAVKYGALSQPAGQVAVRWSVDDQVLRLTWTESGGPPVSVPQVRGFGARMLEHGLAEELRGTVRLDFRAQGLVCAMEAKLES